MNFGIVGAIFGSTNGRAFRRAPSILPDPACLRERGSAVISGGQRIGRDWSSRYPSTQHTTTFAL
jgi:hypothetical protein